LRVVAARGVVQVRPADEGDGVVTEPAEGVLGDVGVPEVAEGEEPVAAWGVDVKVIYTRRIVIFF
jgi:hypothetical protein